MGFFKRLLKPSAFRLTNITRRIERIMENKKIVNGFKTFTPSKFKIYISEQNDYPQNADEKIIKFIRYYADKKRYHLLDEPEVVFKKRADLKSGSVRVEPVLVNDRTTTAKYKKGSILKESKSDITLVFNKKENMNPSLELIQGLEPVKIFGLKRMVNSLGRSEDNQIVINDPSVSRYHARIIFDGDWFIEDLNSTNGVFVNDERVKSASLKENDVIRIGSTLLKFRLR